MVVRIRQQTLVVVIRVNELWLLVSGVQAAYPRDSVVLAVGGDAGINHGGHDS